MLKVNGAKRSERKHKALKSANLTILNKKKICALVLRVNGAKRSERKHKALKAQI